MIDLMLKILKLLLTLHGIAHHLLVFLLDIDSVSISCEPQFIT